MSDGSVVRAVLLETEFGHDWLLRLVLIALLAGLLAAEFRGMRDSRRFLKLAIVLVAAGLAGTLAWAGHGIGGAGLPGSIHLAADFLHLIAAAVWVGGLLPLALMLAVAGRSVAVAHAVSLRFSTYGIVAVGALLLTGAINTWYLAGSIRALTETDYGHLLSIKIALFLVMLALATINRLWLTPALTVDAGEKLARRALRQLRRNVVIEIGAGAVILCVVAVLGVTPPGLARIAPKSAFWRDCGKTAVNTRKPEAGAVFIRDPARETQLRQRRLQTQCSSPMKAEPIQISGFRIPRQDFSSLPPKSKSESRPSKWAKLFASRGR